jgi:hypothetical protein
MGRRSSDEEKRDSSLRGPARKQRAQEKNRAAPLGMTVGVGWCAVQASRPGLNCDAPPALRYAGLSPRKTRGVPTNRGKARRYTQTVVSARGGEAVQCCGTPPSYFDGGPYQIRTNAKMAR